MKEIFTSNLRKLRAEFKVSQPQLAQETGFSKGIISYWETGNRTPSADAIIILSRYFQVTTDFLLKLTNDNTTVYRNDDNYVDMAIFNKRLKDLREKNKLSQTSLSNKTNLSQSSIDNWELGINIPSATAIITLARFFGVTTDYLLGESD